MNKLNRKGFTLVELLAVIVILAIVVGITLVTVLPTLSNAKVKAFETAEDTIETFIREEYDKCTIGDSTIAGAPKIKFTANCAAIDTTQNTYAAVLVAAGYSTADITLSGVTINNGSVTIDACSVANGRFDNSTHNCQ